MSNVTILLETTHEHNLTNVLHRTGGYFISSNCCCATSVHDVFVITTRSGASGWQIHSFKGCSNESNLKKFDVEAANVSPPTSFIKAGSVRHYFPCFVS